MAKQPSRRALIWSLGLAAHRSEAGNEAARLACFIAVYGGKLFASDGWIPASAVPNPYFS